MVELDADTIRHALETARKFGFRTVCLKAEEQTFRAVVGKAPKKASPPQHQALIELDEGGEALIAIEATNVGYLREANTVLTVGHRLERGDIVASIAALGLANDIESPVSGEIVEVCVEPGQPVEYGQVLAKVKPE